MFGSALIAIGTLLYHVGGTFDRERFGTRRVPADDDARGLFHPRLGAESLVAEWKAAQQRRGDDAWEWVRLIARPARTRSSPR